MNLQPDLASPAYQSMSKKQQQDNRDRKKQPRFWGRVGTLAGLAVLGITPWAQAQQALPDLPAVCPPLTAFASPTLFDVWFGTAPIRFPF